MPTKLDVPICVVDRSKIRQLGTSLENIHGMWSVFNKCADSLEDGKRLENLSWRIWNHEARRPTSRSLDSLRPKKTDIPDLSASVESITSEASDDTQGSTLEMDSAPSSGASRSGLAMAIRCPDTDVQRISPSRLEKMVESIQETHSITPLSPDIVDALPPRSTSSELTPRAASPKPRASLRSSESSSSTVPLTSPESDLYSTQTVGSDTSAELITKHAIIRGFSPHSRPSSYTSRTHLAPAPAPSKAIPRQTAEDKKSSVFMLGGSSGDDESSFEEHMPAHPKQSSLTAGLKRTIGKKQTSFKDEVEARLNNKQYHEDEKVFESDDEDSSAIDDSEDESDDDEWVDDGEGSDNAEHGTDERPLFQRVDSQPNLVSRRSLLTSLMHEGDRETAFASMAQQQGSNLRKSRTQPRIDVAAPIENEGFALGSGLMRSKPVAVNAPSGLAMPMALSPRSTRKQMLATEMTESLRKAVLFERQQKKSTSTAVLKRHHTAYDLTNIKQYPATEGAAKAGKAHSAMSSSATVKPQTKASAMNHSWTDDYSNGGIGDYHQTGW